MGKAIADQTKLSSRKLGFGFWMGIIGSCLVGGPPAIAQSPPVPPDPGVVAAPPAVQAVLGIPAREPIVLARTPSERGLTVPSLWWVHQQFGYPIVTNWLAYPRTPAGTGRVDLIVRSNLWSRANYFQRYSLVNHFGTVASDYGYNLLVFDRQNTLVGAYTCNFAPVVPNFLTDVRDDRGRPIPDYVPAKTSQALNCQVWLSPVYPVLLPSLNP